MNDTTTRLLSVSFGLPEVEVEQTLQAMPLEYRVVLRLEHDGTRRSQAAKAEELGCSLAGYKASLVCARSWLRGAASGRRATTTPHLHL